jgi:hypothetical protein
VPEDFGGLGIRDLDPFTIFLSLTERVEEDGETTSQLWLPDEVRQSCDLFKHAERAFLGTGTPIISSATIKDAACLGIRPDEKLFL